MSDSLSNKELVAVGHQFAKAMSSDTALIDMAKIVSRLAERLDCATLALREMTKQRDALASKLEAAEKRIAELEARAVTVAFKPLLLDELGSVRDGKKYSPSFGAGYNCAVIHCDTELRQACANAGIRINGEG